MTKKAEFNREMAPIEDLLGEADFKQLKELKEELTDTWSKAQIFRTETEMRMSVLNDGKHPTVASKYWQSIREQKGMFNSIMECGYNYRETVWKMKKLKRKMDNTDDEIDLEGLQIKYDRLNFRKACIIQEAEDRYREITLWSQIKKELVEQDPNFDTKDVNTHQSVSYEKTLENRRQNLSPGSSQAEWINVLGPLATVQKMNEAKGIVLEGPRIRINEMEKEMLRLTGQSGIGEIEPPKLAPLEERIKARKELGLPVEHLTLKGSAVKQGLKLPRNGKER